MRRIRRAKRGSAAFAALLLTLVLAATVRAELTERGDLFVRFQGGIDPTALPRTERAPIAVEVTGRVKTLSGDRPPALRSIKIELNKGGELNSWGLPKCRYSQLVAVTPPRARAACGDALVGSGTYDARTAFPEQETFPAHGKILAFNGTYRGQEAILAHVFGNNPAPITRVVVFYVHRKAGTYGTVISGTLSDAVNHYGYVVGLSLRFHRLYEFRGQSRSYLSAACAAPSGFSAASFPFARASMGFADGRTLSSALTRSCRVSA